MSVRSVIVLVLALKVISGAVTDFYHSCEGSQICLFEFEVPGFYKFSRESTTVTRLQTARLPKSQIDVSNLLGLRDIFIKSEEGVPNPICQIVTGATEQCIDIHTAQKKPVTCCKVCTLANLNCDGVLIHSNLEIEKAAYRHVFVVLNIGYSAPYVFFALFIGKFIKCVFNLLPNNKILDQSNLKAFVDDKKVNFVVERVENIGIKVENAGYQHFLLFPQCFQKAFF